jgi:uncharacterized delta-60 repeat protein
MIVSSHVYGYASGAGISAYLTGNSYSDFYRDAVKEPTPSSGTGGPGFTVEFYSLGASLQDESPFNITLTASANAVTNGSNYYTVLWGIYADGSYTGDSISKNVYVYTVTPSVTLTETPTQTDTYTDTPTVTITPTMGACGEITYINSGFGGSQYNHQVTEFDLENTAVGPSVMLISVFADPAKVLTNVSYGGVQAVFVERAGINNNAGLRLYRIYNPPSGINTVNVTTEDYDYTVVTAVIYDNVSTIGNVSTNTGHYVYDVNTTITAQSDGDVIAAFGSVRSTSSNITWGAPTSVRIFKSYAYDRGTGNSDMFNATAGTQYTPNFLNSSAITGEVLSIIAVDLVANTYCLTSTVTETSTVTPTYTETPTLTFTATPTSTITNTPEPVMHITVVIAKDHYIPGEAISASVSGYVENYAQSVSISALTIFSGNSANWTGITSNPTPSDSETLDASGSMSGYYVNVYAVGDLTNSTTYSISLSGIASVGKYSGYDTFLLDFGMFCNGDYEYGGETHVIYVDTVTPTITNTPEYTLTSTQTPTGTQTYTATPTASITQTWTITPTYTNSPTITFTIGTSTVTGTVTATSTATKTFTVTKTVTATITGTATVTYMAVKTATPTITATVTPVRTGTATRTRTPNVTSTWTPTATKTGTVTKTATVTLSATRTPTLNVLFTRTVTGTVTRTRTATPTISMTGTRTSTITQTFTVTPTYTATPTVTPTSMPDDEQGQRLYNMFAVAVTNTAANFSGSLADRQTTGPGFYIQNLSNRYDIDLSKLRLRYWMKDEAADQGHTLDDYITAVHDAVKSYFVINEGVAGDPPAAFCYSYWESVTNSTTTFVGAAVTSASRSNQDMALDIYFTGGLLPHNEYDCNTNPPSRSQVNNNIRIKNISTLINDTNFYTNWANDWSFSNDLCDYSADKHRAGLITVYYDGREIIGQLPVETGKYDLHVDCGGFGTSTATYDFKCDRPYNGGAWGVTSYYRVDYTDLTKSFTARLTADADINIKKCDNTLLSGTTPDDDQVYRSTVRNYRYQYKGYVNNNNSANFARNVYNSWDTCDKYYGDDYFNVQVNQQTNYNFDNLPNGKYEVTFRFIELDKTVAMTNDSACNIYINGVMFISGLNVYAAKGLYSAVSETSEAQVTNGRMQITYELAGNTKYQTPRGTLAGIDLHLEEGTFTGMTPKWNCTFPIGLYDPYSPYLNPIYDSCGDYEVPIPTFTDTPTVTPTRTSCPISPTITPTVTATFIMTSTPVTCENLISSIRGNSIEIRRIIFDNNNKIVGTGGGYEGMTLQRFNFDGSLDTSLNGVGILIHNNTLGNAYGMDEGASVCEDSVGNIYIVGSSPNTSNVASMVVWSFDSVGAARTAFGGGFVYKTNTAGGSTYGDVGKAIAIDNNGKIVVAGNSFTSTNNQCVVIWRYNTDGTLDTGNFGAPNGYVVISNTAGANYDSVNDLKIDGSNNIVLTGISYSAAGKNMAIWKYNSQGNPVTTFGPYSNGALYFNSSEGRSIIIDSAGKYFVSGLYGSNMTLWKYNSDGTPDTSFGPSNGYVTDIRTDGLTCFGNSLTLDSCGRILVAGYATSGGEDLRKAIWRYRSDGSLDYLFNQGKGILIGAGDTWAYDIKVDASKKIWLAGASVEGYVLWDYQDVCNCMTP